MEQFIVKGEKYFKKAKEYFKKAKWKKAKKYFNLAISANYEPSLSYLYRGVIALYELEVSQAFQIFQTVLTFKQNEGDIYYYMGKTFQFFDNQIESESYFKKAIFTSRKEVLRLLALEEIEHTFKDNEKEKYYKQAFNAYLIRNQIAEEEEMMRKGVIARLEKDLDRAVDIFKAMIEKYPDYFFAYYELAKTYLKMKNYPFAYAILKKIKQQFKQEKCILYELAKTCFFLRKYQESAYYIKKILRLSPENPKHYFNLANNYALMGKYSDAVFYYKKGLELQPQFFNAYYNIGVIYQKNGFLEEGLEYYKKALSIQPEHPELNYNLGLIYFEMENYVESMYYFMKAYQLDNRLKEALNNFETIRNLRTIENSAIKPLELTLASKLSLAVTLILLMITFFYAFK